MKDANYTNLEYFNELYKSTNYTNKNELLTTAIFILLDYKRQENKMLEDLIESLNKED